MFEHYHDQIIEIENVSKSKFKTLKIELQFQIPNFPKFARGNLSRKSRFQTHLLAKNAIFESHRFDFN